MLRISSLRLPVAYDEQALIAAAAAALRIPKERIQKVVLRKRSLDARKKPRLFYEVTVDVQVAGEQRLLAKNKDPRVARAQDEPYRFPHPGELPLKERPVIAGSGPAGLFCALLLSRMGYAPLLLERGADVDARAQSVARFWQTGILDTTSNVQFGEGGAGTFSDGKLHTLTKDKEGRNRFVLETLARAGADPDILFSNKPHIGTDVLRIVVKNLREEIQKNGGEVRFLHQVTDLRIKDGRLFSILVNHHLEIACPLLVLAIGHSARDTFAMLQKRGVPMEAKSFAVGVRVEHPQAAINEAQYGAHPPTGLPPADYKLAARTRDGRGVYSFCMCPGGYVVNASSTDGELAVNGMSYRDRAGKNANSAIVVTVTPQDFGAQGPLGGIAFQQKLEACAYRAGNGQIPLQLFGDFLARQKSAGLLGVSPATKGAWAFANLRDHLPAFLGDGICDGMLQFEEKIKGFSRPDALLLGVESRTSSPVRILRGADGMSGISGLYPCGEGAGYAGGITSAAMDGLRAAEAIVRKFRKI